MLSLLLDGTKKRMRNPKYNYEVIFSIDYLAKYEGSVGSRSGSRVQK